MELSSGSEGRGIVVGGGMQVEGGGGAMWVDGKDGVVEIWRCQVGGGEGRNGGGMEVSSGWMGGTGQGGMEVTGGLVSGWEGRGGGGMEVTGRGRGVVVPEL
ncbi:hypothetical protein Pcinc_015559 [Petrolisthes cinctipes]|uniref:Uncharacterized protein n=1 Tax=Petrolisthes cinctipes TaxID=88211 RepID=A0AAE1FUQ6_PETCI|nr:hypothetical protein Pcinc_015559 [Petrolisthes cinctipes]